MKILHVNSEIYDYGNCAFQSSILDADDVAELIDFEVGREFVHEDDDNDFSAKIIEFESDITESDLKFINSLLDTEFEELYFIKENVNG